MKFKWKKIKFKLPKGASNGHKVEIEGKKGIRKRRKEKSKY